MSAGAAPGFRPDTRLTTNQDTEEQFKERNQMIAATIIVAGLIVVTMWDSSESK
jgi:hypothetical protein